MVFPCLVLSYEIRSEQLTQRQYKPQSQNHSPLLSHCRKKSHPDIQNFNSFRIKFHSTLVVGKHAGGISKWLSLKFFLIYFQSSLISVPSVSSLFMVLSFPFPVVSLSCLLCYFFLIFFFFPSHSKALRAKQDLTLRLHNKLARLGIIWSVPCTSPDYIIQIHSLQKLNAIC